MNATAAARIFGISARDDETYFDIEEIVQTRDTITDFIKAQGEPTQREEIEGATIHHWLADKRRGRAQDLSVIDGGEFRFAVLS